MEKVLFKGHDVPYLHKFYPQEAEDIVNLARDKKINFRTIKENVVEKYARDMVEGNWVFNGDSVRFDKEGYLIDGQHRLAAVAKSGKPQTFIVMEGLAPEAEMTIDFGVKKSVEDYLRKYHGLEQKGMTAIIRLTITLARGNDQIGHSTYNGRFSESDIVDAYVSNKNKYREAASFAEKIYRDSNKVLKKTYVGAIFYHLVNTMGYDEQLVRDAFEVLSDYRSKKAEKTYVDTIYNRLQEPEKFGRSGKDIMRTYKLYWNTFIKDKYNPGHRINLISLNAFTNEWDNPDIYKKTKKVTSPVFV